ncbi:hypothetical protein [Streptomyces sp. NPDC057340]|uniref:hypothetical protein n=1 Tax=Streptomyces sp. NPDC057340 TaxID=3346103 RepID=UPI003631CABD
MGVEPLTAVPAAAHDPVSHNNDIAPAHGRFTLPHALVIITCIVTAAILAPREMTVTDVLVLIASSGGIGAGIVLVATTGSRRVGRLVRAYLTSGN